MAYIGAPTKYTPKLIQIAEEYIENCPNVWPSLIGLSLWIKKEHAKNPEIPYVCVDTLNQWKTKNLQELDFEKYPRFDEFLQTLDSLNNEQVSQATDKGARNEANATISKLCLAQHGITDKVDVTTGGEQINAGIMFFSPSDAPEAPQGDE